VTGPATSRKRPVRRRGRPPKTTLDDVIDAALRVMDTDGVEALTMARLADEAGVRIMTLYGYVRTRDEIMDLAADRALGALHIEPSPTVPWRIQLETALMDLYRALKAHPTAVELLVSRHASSGPRIDRLRENALSILSQGGIPPTDAAPALSVLVGSIVGIAAVETGRTGRAELLKDHFEELPAGEVPLLKAAVGTWMTPLSDHLVQAALSVLIPHVINECSSK
jgi:AcrR family transcriptional regulator